MKREIDGDILEVPLSGQERILFVDDEDLYVVMGSRMLESQGYRVTVKKDGAEAFQLFCFKPRTFDLVITGQTLPGMTGLELAQKLLSQFFGVCPRFCELTIIESATNGCVLFRFANRHS